MFAFVNYLANMARWGRMKSGIEWIGQIPSDWNVKKCKYVTEFINGFRLKAKLLKMNIFIPLSV